MATGADVIRIAKAELGNSSGRKYWDYIFGGGYVDGGSTPWCACFVSWCLNQANVQCATFPRATAIDRYDIPDSEIIEPKDMRQGDPVGFDWDEDTTGDHIGIFDEWVNDRQFWAVEGNTSGGIVARRLRSIDDVTCAVRPRYDDSGSWVAQDGKWWYRHADGSYTTNGWEFIANEWYWFDASGWLKSGWLKLGDDWYWLHDKHDGRFGEMAKSTCVEVDGKWYAFDSTGAMITDVKVNQDHDGTFGCLVL